MSESPVQPGQLYVVATPIGNLSDLSPRALKVLAAVDRIAAEDTRTSAQMLSHFGVRRPMVALHEHNEDALAAELVAKMAKGESLALVCDAGTPLVSDPGFALVRAARAAGVPVVTVPGPCAAIAALSISGVPSDSFLFVGFLPAKDAARSKKLEELARESRTLIFYEASHRIVESVQAIAQLFGAQRKLCLARELTKLFEQSITAPAAEVAAWLQQDPNRQKGEFVLVVAGAEHERAPAEQAERLLRVLVRELPPARAAKVAAELTGLKRQELYDVAVRLGGGGV